MVQGADGLEFDGGLGTQELGACRKVWIWDRGPGWRGNGAGPLHLTQSGGCKDPSPTPTSHAPRSQRLTVGVPEWAAPWGACLAEDVRSPAVVSQPAPSRSRFAEAGALFWKDRPRRTP